MLARGTNCVPGGVFGGAAGSGSARSTRALSSPCSNLSYQYIAVRSRTWRAARRAAIQLATASTAVTAATIQATGIIELLPTV